MKILSKAVLNSTLFLSSFLALRFLLKLAGANLGAPFVGWLYDFTDIFMVPFENIFPSPSLGPQYVVDVPALFALSIYMLIGYVLSVLIAAVDRGVRERIDTFKRNLKKRSKNKPSSGPSGPTGPSYENTISPGDIGYQPPAE